MLTSYLLYVRSLATEMDELERQAKESAPHLVDSAR
jgi:hypothetical protein